MLNTGQSSASNIMNIGLLITMETYHITLIINELTRVKVQQPRVHVSSALSSQGFLFFLYVTLNNMKNEGGFGARWPAWTFTCLSRHEDFPRRQTHIHTQRWHSCGSNITSFDQWNEIGQPGPPPLNQQHEDIPLMLICSGLSPAEAARLEDNLGHRLICKNMLFGLFLFALYLRGQVGFS